MKSHARPSVEVKLGEMIVADGEVFAFGREARAELFLRRVFSAPELEAVEIDPARATARLVFRTDYRDKLSVPRRLARAAGGRESVTEGLIPPWRLGEPVTFRRFGGVISTLDVLVLNGRLLRARHLAIWREGATAARVREALLDNPGVLAVTLSPRTATLEVRFDGAAVAARALLRVIETTLIALPDIALPPSADRPSYGMALAAVGVTGVATFAVPALMPVAAAFLLVNSWGAFKEAMRQAAQGRLGLPALYTGINVTSVIVGGAFSWALMSWFLCFWERRHLEWLENENRSLLAETAFPASEARLIGKDGGESSTPRALIAPGQRVRVFAGEAIPFDGEIVDGAALISDGFAGRANAFEGRGPGDEALAGEIVSAGQIVVVVKRSSEHSRAAQFGRALLATTTPNRSGWALTERSEAFASRLVAPTFVAAAGGLLIGGAEMANGVLRPDYATGMGLAEPLRMMRVNRVATRFGALVRSRAALERMTAGSVVVIDDHEELEQSEWEVAEFRAHGIAEDQLLAAVASAAAWLGDPRGAAISRAAAKRGLLARRGVLGQVEPGGVSINYGPHVVRLHGPPRRTSLPALRIEVDGVEAGGVFFHRSGRLPAARVVRKLRRAGVRVILASHRQSDPMSGLGRLLGVDGVESGLDAAGRRALLMSLHQRGSTVVHLRDGVALPHYRDDYVSIGLPGREGIRHDADIVLMRRSMASLPALFRLARDSAGRGREDCLTTLGPNLAAVAAVFAFGLTGLSVVLVSNMATYWTQERARRALKQAKENRFAAEEFWTEADAEPATPAPAAPGRTGRAMRTRA